MSRPQPASCWWPLSIFHCWPDSPNSDFCLFLWWSTNACLFQHHSCYSVGWGSLSLIDLCMCLWNPLFVRSPLPLPATCTMPFPAVQIHPCQNIHVFTNPHCTNIMSDFCPFLCNSERMVYLCWTISICPMSLSTTITPLQFPPSLVWSLITPIILTPDLFYSTDAMVYSHRSVSEYNELICHVLCAAL